MDKEEASQPLLSYYDMLMLFYIYFIGYLVICKL